MTTEYIPSDLFTAIEEKLRSFSDVDLGDAYKTLQQNYKENTTLKRSEEQLAYLATRMPETYAVLRHLFSRFFLTLGEIKTLLDVGSGPGTTVWAAEPLFSQLEEITCIEKEKFFLEVAKELIKDRAIYHKINWIHEDITQVSLKTSHDLVVLSYVLNELPESSQSTLIDNMYEKVGKYLLLIEPGTPKGYQNILMARKKLIDKGAFILGPCSHEKVCALEERFYENKDWCHFSVRLERPSFTQITKKGKLSYEDEKFCYLLVSPLNNGRFDGRVIRPPYHRKGHTIVDLCQDGKIERKIISKKESTLYKQAKKIEWGDSWLLSDSESSQKKD